jgi:hypothetical protein
MGPQILKILFSCTIEIILSGYLTAWYGSSLASDSKKPQKVVRMAQYITLAEVLAIQDLLYQAVSEEGPNFSDSSHPSHKLFSLLLHSKQYQRAKSGTKRLLNSFYPQAIRQLNS